jgi:hypothetical protein
MEEEDENYYELSWYSENADSTHLTILHKDSEVKLRIPSLDSSSTRIRLIPNTSFEVYLQAFCKEKASRRSRFILSTKEF